MKTQKTYNQTKQHIKYTETSFHQLPDMVYSNSLLSIRCCLNVLLSLNGVRYLNASLFDSCSFICFSISIPIFLLFKIYFYARLFTFYSNCIQIS